MNFGKFPRKYSGYFFFKNLFAAYSSEKAPSLGHTETFALFVILE